MVTASITETRRRLSELIELARQGEDVIIIKDSRPVAALHPIDAADLELTPRLTDQQAQRLIEWTDSQPKKTFRSAAAAVKWLKKDMAKKR
jgi:prevent-host-death family protein